MSTQSNSVTSGHPFPRILVSVLSYNSAEYLLTTLRTLQCQNYPNYKLQVVDNASSDNSVAELAIQFPDVSLTVLPENLGYTGGSNFVLKQALNEGYDCVVLCNHDIEVDKNALANLVETATANENAGVVGGVEVSFLTGKRRASAGGVYHKWTSRMSWLEAPQDPGDEVQRVQCVHGALVLFTRKALEANVRMDEELFMYFDELDVGFQLSAKGLAAYTDQRVLFKHRSEPYQFHEFTGYLSQRNRVYMIDKYGNWYHRLFYHCYSLLLELPAKTVLRLLQGHTRFAVACLKGHADGVFGRMDRFRIYRFLTGHSR